MGIPENQWQVVYQAHIQSRAWAEFRAKVLAKRGRFCEVCRSVDRIHLHHLTYERFGEELESDVQVLCYACHNQAHDGKLDRLHAEAAPPPKQGSRKVCRHKKKNMRLKPKRIKADALAKKWDKRVVAQIHKRHKPVNLQTKAISRWQAAQSHPVTLKPIIDLTEE